MGLKKFNLLLKSHRNQFSGGKAERQLRPQELDLDVKHPQLATSLTLL